MQRCFRVCMAALNIAHKILLVVSQPVQAYKTPPPKSFQATAKEPLSRTVASKLNLYQPMGRMHHGVLFESCSWRYPCYLMI